MATKICVIFALLGGIWIAQAAIDCKVTGAGRFADPDDVKCKNYTLCIYVKATDSYLAYHTICPSISVFNPQISRCTSPSNFACNPSVIIPKPSATTICKFDGFISDPEPTNCTTYIQCVQIHGAFTQLRHSCPEGTFFNPDSTLCESNYQCKDFTCVSPGRFVDVYDFTCKKYFYCVQLHNGTYAQFRYACPAASHFNPVTKLCTTKYVCS